MLEEIKPGINTTSFYINFNEKFLGIDDTVVYKQGQFKVIERPNRKWYKLLFQYLSFGIYKAPWEYKVKPI